MENTKHPFSADRPITSCSEDLLGRSGFAKSIAASIKGWTGNDSLVIALYSSWGSGKTSIKNMAVETLRSSEETCPLIVEFNPWQWAGQEQLADAFFQQIGLVLGKDTSKEGKKRTAKWRAYAAYLKAGSFFAHSLRNTIFWILLMIGFVGLGGLFSQLTWIKTTLAIIVFISFALSVLLMWGGRFSEQIAGILSARSEARRQSLPEIKKDLTEVLQKLKKPVLVVIDDVDRLSAEEIKFLFQLVKANADFPNLVYLLLFQRDVVEKGLENITGLGGKEFLEKIVQVGFDIPQIERSRLEKTLFSGLDRLLEQDSKILQRFSQQYWGNIFIAGLRQYFATLRDVNRFLSTLSFHISLFRSGGSFEVNPIDLIALEVLRTFEPAVYQKLYGAKDALTERRDSMKGGKEEEKKRAVELIVEEAEETNRPQVREILKQLFPHTGWIFGGFAYGSGYEEEWFRDLRACHPGIFDRYFHFAIPERDISQAELDRILSLVGDRDGLATELRAFNARGLLGIVLDRLEAYKEKIDIKHAIPFIAALFDIGDELPEELPGFLTIGAETHASRVIFWYLKQEKDWKKRAYILKEAMKITNGVYLPVMRTSLEESKEARKKDPDAFIVDAEDLKDLRNICVEKIRQAAESGALKTHSEMARILYPWREWATPEQPKKWVEDLVESQNGALFLLTAFTQRSTSQGIGDYVPKIHWRISLTSLENFISIDVLEQKVKEIDLTGIGEKEQRAVQAFQKALKRRQEGKSDDDWRDDED
jgi:predicted KAP-like P-loop ATPase